MIFEKFWIINGAEFNPLELDSTRLLLTGEELIPGWFRYSSHIHPWNPAWHRDYSHQHHQIDTNRRNQPNSSSTKRCLTASEHYLSVFGHRMSPKLFIIFTSIQNSPQRIESLFFSLVGPFCLSSIVHSVGFGFRLRYFPFLVRWRFIWVCFSIWIDRSFGDDDYPIVALVMVYCFASEIEMELLKCYVFVEQTDCMKTDMECDGFFSRFHFDSDFIATFFRSLGEFLSLVEFLEWPLKWSWGSGSWGLWLILRTLSEGAWGIWGEPWE